MSYILNALRKSEQERQAQQEKTLTSEVLALNNESQTKKPIWLILLVIINIGILGYFGIHIIAEPESIPKQKKLKNYQLPPKINIPEIPVVKKPETVSHKTKAVRKKTDKLLTIDEVIKTRKTKAKIISQQAVKKSQPPPPQKSTVKTAIPIREPQVKEQNKTLSLLSELPYQFRRNVPDIDINVFVYSELAENRFIMVDMQKYKSGQELVSGMVLNEIQEDGIVVEYKGRVFKINRN